LVNIEDEKQQLDLYKSILTDSLSVRQTEQLAQNLKTISPKKSTHSKKTQKTPLPFSIQQISQEFEKKTNCSTEIKLQKNGKGKLIISFKNEEQLEHIIQCFQSE